MRKLGVTLSHIASKFSRKISLVAMPSIASDFYYDAQVLSRAWTIVTAIVGVRIVEIGRYR